MLFIFCCSNVSKYNYAFSDFPFPEEIPDYPHNTQMATYVKDYVQHFGLEKLIHYHTQVNEITKSGKSFQLFCSSYLILIYEIWDLHKLKDLVGKSPSTCQLWAKL